jgi:hypothetical protein
MYQQYRDIISDRWGPKNFNYDALFLLPLLFTELSYPQYEFPAAFNVVFAEIAPVGLQNHDIFAVH